MVFAAQSAKLHYLPNIPVQLESELKIDITQSLPGLSLSTKGNQKFAADLTMQNFQSELPIAAPPFVLKFVLNHLDIALQANDEELNFRSDKLGGSLYLNQLSNLIDHPVYLQFDKDFLLAADNVELRQAAAQLPVLSEINPANILAELFLHLFAAGGRDLYVGKVIEKDISEWQIPSLPKIVAYTISEIDDYNVYASISGSLEKQTLELDGKVNWGGSSKQVQASLSGEMFGKIRWNRDNAMLYSLSLEYSYSARFQLAAQEWLMNVSLILQNQSKLK